MRRLRTTIPRYVATGAKKWLRRQIDPRNEKQVVLPVSKMVVDLYPHKLAKPLIGGNAYSPACLIAIAFLEKRRGGIFISWLRPDLGDYVVDEEMNDEQIVARLKEIFDEAGFHPALVTRILHDDARLRALKRKNINLQSVDSFFDAVAA